MVSLPGLPALPAAQFYRSLEYASELLVRKMSGLLSANGCRIMTVALYTMDGGSRKDGAIRENCGQESDGFGNARAERMSQIRTEGEGLLMVRTTRRQVNKYLDSCDLEVVNRIKQVLSPAAWQIGSRRHRPPSRRWTIGHGRTPTAAEATRALVADRHPPWIG
jgi:hypothetical protein